MNSKSKRDIRNKARLTAGLVNILKYDVNNLVMDTNECDLNSLFRTMEDVKETTQNVIDVLAEIEYILYLNQFKES